MKIFLNTWNYKSSYALFFFLILPYFLFCVFQNTGFPLLFTYSFFFCVQINNLEFSVKQNKMLSTDLIQFGH